MKHIPHLVVPAPWNGETLPVSVVQWRHLTKVLRMNRGDAITYTDGLGNLGSGILGNQTVVRGEERHTSRGTELTVAAAPPANKDRQRYLVEKLSELGVARLLWLKTEHGLDRISAAPKQFAWVVAAVEQSRGAWLMETSQQMSGLKDLEGVVVMCDPSGDRATPVASTIAVGPEGGWAEGEIPASKPTWSLGDNILRVETAAVVAAARILGG